MKNVVLIGVCKGDARRRLRYIRYLPLYSSHHQQTPWFIISKNLTNTQQQLKKGGKLSGKKATEIEKQHTHHTH